MTEKSAEDEFVIAMFEAARDEIVARIKLRDTLIASYAAAVAAAIGFSKAALGAPHPEVLYILPYLAFAFSVLVSYHHLGVATLGAYCNKELWPKLQVRPVPMYETSQTFIAHRQVATRQRSLGQMIILVGPAFLALAVNGGDALNQTPPRVLYWWFGLVAMLLSMYVIHKAYEFQKELQRA